MTPLIAIVTVLIVISLFNQKGKVERSAQRVAAITMGHADRKTLFEQPVIGSLMWILLRTVHSLRATKLKAWLARTLTSAGNPNFYTPEEYLALSLLTGLVLAGFTEALSVISTGQIVFSWALLAIFSGVVLSLFYIYDKAHKRLVLIAKRLPYALDLISLAMGAGASFAEAVDTIIHENPSDPLNVEFRTLLAEMQLGETRAKAMSNLASRVPIESMQSLIASVVQAEQLGTPLGSTLHDQATLLRLNRSVRAETLAAKASIRILLPCLLLVMAVTLTVLGPFLLKFFSKGLF